MSRPRRYVATSPSFFISDLAQNNARRSIMAFLQDQSSDGD